MMNGMVGGRDLYMPDSGNPYYGMRAAEMSSATSAQPRRGILPKSDIGGEEIPLLQGMDLSVNDLRMMADSEDPELRDAARRLLENLVAFGGVVDRTGGIRNGRGMATHDSPVSMQAMPGFNERRQVMGGVSEIRKLTSPGANRVDPPMGRRVGSPTYY